MTPTPLSRSSFECCVRHPASGADELFLGTRASNVPCPRDCPHGLLGKTVACGRYRAKSDSHVFRFTTDQQILVHRLCFWETRPTNSGPGSFRETDRRILVHRFFKDNRSANSGSQLFCKVDQPILAHNFIQEIPPAKYGS